MNRFSADPLNAEYWKSDFHHSMAAGLKQSTQWEEPGQHHPSYALPSLLCTARSFLVSSSTTWYPTFFLMCGSIMATSLRSDSSNCFSIPMGSGKVRGSHVKYCLSSVYSMSSQITSYGI